MMGSNYSFGFERSPEQLVKNDRDHRKWTNPLEIRLPTAPSMSIYCRTSRHRIISNGTSTTLTLSDAVYGTGKETERSYFYQQGGYESDDVASPSGSSECIDGTLQNCTARVALDLPLSRRSWIDSSVTLETQEPAVRSGKCSPSLFR